MVLTVCVSIFKAVLVEVSATHQTFEAFTTSYMEQQKSSAKATFRKYKKNEKQQSRRGKQTDHANHDQPPCHGWAPETPPGYEKAVGDQNDTKLY